MDIKQIRKEFPFFQSQLNREIVYLDSAATTQKPQVVIDSITDYYINNNANINRGAYRLSTRSTEIFENTRKKVAKYINAESEDNIIFTKSATESINLVVYGYGLKNLKEGDEVLISIVEHHSNLVGWQFICQLTGAKLKYFNIDKDYNFDIKDYKSKLSNKTKIVAFTAASNVLSTKVPINEIIKLAKEKKAITLLDGAQIVAHDKVDVKDYDCDFFVFSGHKMYSEMGVGVLYGKEYLLKDMNPFLYGGDMIEYVTKEKSTYSLAPQKFEGGTQNVSAVNSLSFAIDYINSIGIENIKNREEMLTLYCIEKMKNIDFIDLYYSKNNYSGSNIMFNVKNVHPHDVAQILDFNNICIRAGHHCTQVLHRYLGLNSSCRVSIAFYNTKEEIDKFIDALNKVKEVFYGK